MSQVSASFPYLPRHPGLGAAGYAPLLPITLSANGQRVDVHGLPDTGADINVLPWSVGDRLGFEWRRQTVRMPLGGVLASVEARLVIVTFCAPPFAPLDMGFAWLATDAAPLLLGQMTFFNDFHVCFFRSRGTFEVTRA